MALELVAYADESGVHAEASYCVVSGFIASPRQWKLFEVEWQRVLERYGVPDFHSTQFFQRDQDGRRLDHYRTWNDERALSFIRDLMEAVKNHSLHSIGGAVNVSDFNSFSIGERRFITGAGINESGKPISTGAPTRPYQLAFATLLLEACQSAQEGTKVHFIFDRNHVEQALATQYYISTAERKLHRQWEKLGRLTFASRLDEIPLQVADLHTYAWYALHVRGPAGLGQELQITLTALGKKRDVMRHWNKRLMEELLDKLTPAQREGLKARP